jgi:hypothetical protein
MNYLVLDSMRSAVLQITQKISAGLYHCLDMCTRRLSHDGRGQMCNRAQLQSRVDANFFPKVPSVVMIPIMDWNRACKVKLLRT